MVLVKPKFSQSQSCQGRLRASKITPVAKGKKKAGSLLNGANDLTRADTGKAKVLNAFYYAFMSRVYQSWHPPIEFKDETSSK